MGRIKTYHDTKERQRAYRWRRRMEGLSPRAKLALQAEWVHGLIAECAATGDQVAAQILGEDYQETALRLLVRFGPGKVERAIKAPPDQSEPLKRLGIQ